MVIDQYLTSIANFLWRAGKGANSDLKVCFHEIPENGKLPTIYFPNPSVLSGNDTLSSYMLDYSWFIKIIAVSNEQAYEIASEIQRHLCYKRNKVPVLNQDGSEAGFNITLTQADIKQIDTHTYQLTVSWQERNEYETLPSEPFCEIQASVVSKGVPFDVLLDDNNNILTDEEGIHILITTGGQ